MRLPRVHLQLRFFLPLGKCTRTACVTSMYHFTGESPTSDARHNEDIHGTSPSPGSGKLQPHSGLSWGHENLGMSPVSCISSYT